MSKQNISKFITNLYEQKNKSAFANLEDIVTEKVKARIKDIIEKQKGNKKVSAKKSVKKTDFKKVFKKAPKKGK